MVIRSLIDALERKKAKEQQSKNESLSKGLIDSPTLSNDLLCQIKRPNAFFPIARRRGRPQPSLVDDDSIMLIFQGTNFRSTIFYILLIMDNSIKTCFEERACKLERIFRVSNCFFKLFEDCQLEIEIATKTFHMNDYKKGKNGNQNVDKEISEYAVLNTWQPQYVGRTTRRYGCVQRGDGVADPNEWTSINSLVAHFPKCASWLIFLFELIYQAFRPVLFSMYLNLCIQTYFKII